MNCPHCDTERPRTCPVCSETLCCAEGASRCFIRHPLPPTRDRLVAQIIETADSEAEAADRIARLDGFLGRMGAR
jgi:hypothetical protein